MSQLDETPKFILVAGSGTGQIPESQYWLSDELGKGLAREGYGLVVGGWPGVDYLVTRSFVETLTNENAKVESRLIQVVMKGQQPHFQAKSVLIEADESEKEWTEAVRYCDATVLIGGLGGAFSTYLFCSEQNKPVFPFADSRGDARNVYSDLICHWNRLPIEGISRERFERVMGQRIASQTDAARGCQ